MRDSLRILMLNLEYPPLGGGAGPVTRGLARALVLFGGGTDDSSLCAKEPDERALRVSWPVV